MDQEHTSRTYKQLFFNVFKLDVIWSATSSIGSAWKCEICLVSVLVVVV